MAPEGRGEERKVCLNKGWDRRALQGGTATAGRPESQGRRGKTEFLLAEALGPGETHPSSNGCLLEVHSLLLARNVIELRQGLPVVRQALKALELPLPD